jgi:pimeloyl-ACP methyl ester carboxylesterase
MRLLTSVLIVASLAVVPAAEAAKKRVEKPVRSSAPDASRVKESFVRLRAPLPEEVGEHPKACDWITYLRFRHPRGPRKAPKADAVVVLIPGFLGGAGSFDQLARNAVRNAGARGRRIEVWALDRRANCLEDHHGVRAAARAGDVAPAFDYYYEGEEVEGRRFAGFKSPDEARFLEHFGLDRTVRDWYTVLRREIPGQKRRARKVVCGGHSLGGPLTAAFASWDFDGDPETKRDAGYKQCRALVGLDTTVDIGGSGGGPSGGPGVPATGAAPYINVPPLTPGTMQLPAIIGVAAYQQPDAESTVNSLVPTTPEYETTLRALYSRDAVQFATGQPSVRELRLTNATVLGGVFDDNSAPLSFLRASVGFVHGGPLWDKNFPAPDPTLALPREVNGPLYQWMEYDAVGAEGAPPVANNDAGQPYTARDSEVSSLAQLARTMFEAPSNFIEQYFPTKIVADVAAAEGGDRSGDLENLRYDGPSKRPILHIQAGDSDSNEGEDSGPKTVGEAPNELRFSREVVLPGYNHLDVLTAARRQNDGDAEVSSVELARFALKVTRAKRR